MSEKDVDAAEEKLIDERFDGKREDYEKALEKQGFTAEQYRENALEVSALSSKIFDEVTKDVKVTDQEILAYYTQNQSQYGTPESRDVRHILIAEKDGRQGRLRREQGEGGRDLRASSQAAPTSRRWRRRAPRTREARTRAASSRSPAARPFPSSTRSRSSSTRASSRSPSRPSTATTSSRRSPTSARRQTTPIDKVKPTIRATLLQEKRNEEMQAWVEDLQEGLRGQGELRGRLRAAAAPGDTRPRPSRVSRA